MKHDRPILKLLFAFTILMLLMIDSKTAADGAKAGIELCCNVIVPSLFPFFLITTWLNSILPAFRIPGLYQLARLLHIPEGGEGMLLLGLIGGYPVGAQAVADTYRRSKLDPETAAIMLGYCSNAGPAFIFGVTGVLFSSFWIPLVLWLIHMLSAVVTGLLLPKPITGPISHNAPKPLTLAQSMKSSIEITASVCGWIILFQTLIYIANAHIQHTTAFSVMMGLLEISAGCLQLSEHASRSVQFILCSAYLGFGGICVMMQTASVTAALGMGLYPYGKLMQTILSILIATPTAWLIFREFSAFHPAVLLLFIACILMLTILRIICRKKLWKLYPSCSII